MDAVRTEFLRVLIILHHNYWMQIALAFGGVGAFILASHIRNTAFRNLLFVASGAILIVLMVIGLSIDPIDNWQHYQYGSCLLESLKKK